MTMTGFASGMRKHHQEQRIAVFCALCFSIKIDISTISVQINSNYAHQGVL